MMLQAIAKEPVYKTRQAKSAAEATILADIYDEDVNVSIWQRELTSELDISIKQFLLKHPDFHTAMSVSPQRVKFALQEEIGSVEFQPLLNDVEELVDMFSCLFELSNVGLRLKVLNSAMCPKFHVDKVPCRMVTSYYGPGTEWLPHEYVDRSKLGHGSKGMTDDESGLYSNNSSIHQLNVGEVALLKGENWTDNEGAGLVHRSPSLSSGERRLLLSLDFAD